MMDSVSEDLGNVIFSSEQENTDRMWDASTSVWILHSFKEMMYD